MLERISETIRRYGMFETGQRVGVAVSGGRDSVCLLDVLRELASSWDLRLSVLHLNHQLRGEESERDAEFVHRLAEGLGLPFHMERASLPPGNLEQAGREARRQFFRRFLDSGELDRVALGHTRSDQAETVLFRILRGAGSAGLAGIRPVTKDGIVRPLIQVDRRQVAAYLTARGLAWCEDSTNSSLAFARNRIRLDLLPELERAWNPEVGLALSHMADWAFEEEQYWERATGELAERSIVARPPALLLRVHRLEYLPRAMARRLIRHVIGKAKGDLRGVGFQHVEDVLALVGRLDGSGHAQVPGVEVERSFDWLRFLKKTCKSKQRRDFCFSFTPPCQIRLPGADIEVVAELEAPEAGYTERVSGLDWDRCVSGPLELRNWRPGDQYRPVGSANPEKLKALFQQARIPSWERHGWPVLSSADTIVWTRQFGVAAACAAKADSRLVLRIREIDKHES